MIEVLDSGLLFEVSAGLPKPQYMAGVVGVITTGSAKEACFLQTALGTAGDLSRVEAMLGGRCGQRVLRVEDTVTGIVTIQACEGSWRCLLAFQVKSLGRTVQPRLG